MFALSDGQMNNEIERRRDEEHCGHYDDFAMDDRDTEYSGRFGNIHDDDLMHIDNLTTEPRDFSILHEIEHELEVLGLTNIANSHDIYSGVEMDNLMMDMITLSIYEEIDHQLKGDNLDPDIREKINTKISGLLTNVVAGLSNRGII